MNSVITRATTTSTPTTAAGRPGGGASGARPAARRVGLLAALAAVVVGGTALVAAPAVPAAGFGGGRFLAAAAPVLGADKGTDRADGGRHRTATVRTTARATVHRDGRDRRDTAWRVKKVTAESLVARNRAAATARDCTGCDAVAVSVQVVVDSRSTGAVEATNRAVAVTSGCTRCSATALAYQFVVAGPGKLRLTDAAKDRLRSLHRQMRDVAKHADPADVTAREDAIAARIADVLRTGVVVVPADGASSGTATYHRVGGAGTASGGVRVTVHRAHDRA